MIENDDAFIYGECDPWPTKEDMAALLNGVGIEANLGAYSVRLPACCGISFECYGGDFGAPQVESKPASVEALLNAANHISHALATSGIRHRFEIYDAKENLAGYVHHNWPQTVLNATALVVEPNPSAQADRQQRC